MLMEYSIGKQRSPFGFQSHPKYSLNKHSFPKNVITAKFGSMNHERTSCESNQKPHLLLGLNAGLNLIENS